MDILDLTCLYKFLHDKSHVSVSFRISVFRFPFSVFFRGGGGGGGGNRGIHWGFHPSPIIDFSPKPIPIQRFVMN